MTRPERQLKRARGVRRELLLRALLKGETDLEALASHLELNLVELATIYGEARTAGALAGLRRLADVQTQLMVSRYRLTAAAKLIALANQDDDAELARKACGDLLKLDLISSEAIANADDSMPIGIDEQSVLDALRRLGQEEEPLPTSEVDAADDETARAGDSSLSEEEK